MRGRGAGSKPGGEADAERRTERTRGPARIPFGPGLRGAVLTMALAVLAACGTPADEGAEPGAGPGGESSGAASGAVAGDDAGAGPDSAGVPSPPADPPPDSAAFVTVRGETDRIRVESPRPGEVVTSPLTIRGEARGNWFFEGDFPVILTDWDGLIIAEHWATALEPWMTMDFVPFEAVIEFEIPPDLGDFSRRGSLILQKDNPSDLPQLDDALEFTVYFRAPQ